MPAIPEEPVKPDDAAIVFDKVSMAFDDNVVLRNVSFSVRPASTVFLLGASGSWRAIAGHVRSRPVDHRGGARAEHQDE
jgi:ABC-type multidrug transport system fused ATPase/permease subunit